MELTMTSPHPIRSLSESKDDVPATQPDKSTAPHERHVSLHRNRTLRSSASVRPGRLDGVGQSGGRACKQSTAEASRGGQVSTVNPFW